MLEKQE
jgi:hypothetical protein